MSVISEIVQDLISTRSFDSQDIYYNLIGSSLGIISSVFIESLPRIWSQPKTSQYMPLENLNIE